MSSAPQVSAQPSAPAGAPARILQLRLESKPIIYASYMSFLEYGGVFMPSNDKFAMGEEILLVLELVGPAKPKNCLLKPMFAGLTPTPAAAVAPKAWAWRLARTNRA